MCRKLTFILILLFVILSTSVFTQSDKLRLLVLTDIGGDPDDIQSLRRLLVYANELWIEGIIATATWGERPHRKRGVYFINEHLIHEADDDYARVYANLILHDADYPPPDELRSVVRGGQKNRGVANLISGKSTPGSQHIIESVDVSIEPLWITIWGGAHDLAQALLDVKETRSEEELNQFVQKLRVYSIGDQDIKFTTEGTSQWIRDHFPTIFYIEAGPQWVRSQRGSSAGYVGMYQNDFRGRSGTMIPLVQEGHEMNDTTWVKENVLPFGALGERFPPDVNLIPKSPRNSRGVKEGDTPAWFYVLPHGMNDPG